MTNQVAVPSDQPTYASRSASSRNRLSFAWYSGEASPPRSLYVGTILPWKQKSLVRRRTRGSLRNPNPNVVDGVRSPQADFDMWHMEGP
jgi:hypothetical protein